jgi:translocation and assembly module TamA
LVNLKENIEGKVSSFTEESFEDFPSALPQLRSLSNQAAQAVGFYNAEFKFEKTSSNRVRIQVVPNNLCGLKNKTSSLVVQVSTYRSSK